MIKFPPFFPEPHNEKHAVRTPADLLVFPLFAQAKRREAWPAWLHHMGVPVDHMVAGPVFDHFLMLAEAARQS
jgi:hypothetical protein